MVDAGWAPTVSQKWILASAGERGLSEISQFYQEAFLAAAPLDSIQAAHGLLQQTRSAARGLSWLPRVKANRFCLVESSDGNRRWLLKDGLSRGEKILLEGDLDDFTSMVREGSEILHKCAYKQIFKDVRPDEPGHPWDWLRMMQSPETWGPARQIFWTQPHE